MKQLHVVNNYYQHEVDKGKFYRCSSTLINFTLIINHNVVIQLDLSTTATLEGGTVRVKFLAKERNTVTPSRAGSQNS